MVGSLFPGTTLTPHDRRGSLEEISRGGGRLVAHFGSGLVLPTKSTALPLRKELTYLQHADHDCIGLADFQVCRGDKSVEWPNCGVPYTGQEGLRLKTLTSAQCVEASSTARG